ncbi:ABC transporter ATP-binding protein [Streptococcus ratti]|uniref:ABC transporter ATP-binding protein n=1 Tax=Streptococcus ratti TaxID=1341 RepID=A0A7X9LE94_STRRT|nr:ABC transporter ATP-binding protein [Streptococcus ratti]
MGISVSNLNFFYDKKQILHNISFELEEGRLIALIGPNGSGKSTLLRTMLNLEKPNTGFASVNQHKISSLSHKERAKIIAFLSQSPQLQNHMTVEDLVKLGRQNHKSLFGSLKAKDLDYVHHAINWVGLEEQAQESVLSLSGGQRQRAFLAMVLAQDTEYIFLDEPTSYLDIHHQIEFIELLKKLQNDFHKTIVIVLHDLSLVSKYADHIITLKEGHLYATGKTNHVFTETMLWDVFGVCATICPIKNSSQILSYDFRRR